MASKITRPAAARARLDKLFVHVALHGQIVKALNVVRRDAQGIRMPSVVHRP
jgi:hypothetical protein